MTFVVGAVKDPVPALVTLFIRFFFLNFECPTIKWFKGLELVVLCFVSQAIARPTLKVVLHPGHCATAFARTQAIANKVSGHLPQHHLKWKPDSRFPFSCHLPSGKRLLAGSSFKRNSKASFGSILAFLFSTRFSSFRRTRKPIAGATSRTSRFKSWCTPSLCFGEAR